MTVIFICMKQRDLHISFLMVSQKVYHTSNFNSQVEKTIWKAICTYIGLYILFKNQEKEENIFIEKKEMLLL